MTKRHIGLTQEEAPGHLQVGTLAKVIHGGDAELVGGFFREAADGDLRGNDGFPGIAPLPCLSANLLLLHNVALDGYRAVAVWRRPLNGEGRVRLVLHHSIDRGIGRMLPGG